MENCFPDCVGGGRKIWNLEQKLILSFVKFFILLQINIIIIIIGDEYESYPSALESCGLETLHARRESRCLNFALKCVKHPVNSRLFPLNEAPVNNLRKTEKFVVNFARTSAYQNSAIPHCQKLLNNHHSS